MSSAVVECKENMDAFDQHIRRIMKVQHNQLAVHKAIQKTFQVHVESEGRSILVTLGRTEVFVDATDELPVTMPLQQPPIVHIAMLLAELAWQDPRAFIIVFDKSELKARALAAQKHSRLALAAALRESKEEQFRQAAFAAAEACAASCAAYCL